MRPLSLALFVLFGANAIGCTSDDAGGDDAADCSTPEACAQALSTAPAPFSVGTVQAAKYPIVLHHGFNASTTNSWSFYKVKEALEADGDDVTTTEVEPFNGVPTRAARLKSILEDVRTNACRKQGYTSDADVAACLRTMKVNIIAHSMGGLDARYVAATLGYAPNIASITTLSTPHGGSNIADVGLGLTPDGGKLGAVMDQLVACFGRTFTQDDLANDTNLRAALESLSEANAPAFNRDNPDQPGVYYQSYAGVSRLVGGRRFQSERNDVLHACEGKYFGDIGRADFMALQLTLGSVVVGHFSNVPQDGMVTVENAKHGNFRGCYPSDHLDEVGEVKHDHPDVFTQFDHRVFFRMVASDLAKRGF